MLGDDRPPEWIELLSASYTVEILQSAGHAKSASELSHEIEAPIATVYRRIEALVADGLLERTGNRLSADGRQEKVYRRTLDGFCLKFTMAGVAIEKESHSEARAALADTWSTLRSSGTSD